MKKVWGGVLILEQPVDGWLVVHGLGDRFGGRFAIRLEQQLRIVLHVDD